MAEAADEPALPWSKEISQFLTNIGDGCGYFRPQPMAPPERGTAVKVVRTQAHQDVPSDKVMVLKVLPLKDKDKEWIDKFTKPQTDVLQNLRHENLAVAYKVFADPTSCLWFVEYDWYRCNLAAAVNNHADKRLPESKGRKLCRQIIAGLQFLHQKDWPHRDLKMENVLVTQADTAVLTDFAFTHEQMTGRPNPQTGSLMYAAPELLTGSGQCDLFQADVWALGVIFYAMHSDTEKFRESADMHAVAAQRQHMKHAVKHEESGFSPPLNSLVRKLLATKADKRMTLEGAAGHPWMQDQPPEKESTASVAMQ